jgi:hypothetical protein
MKNVIFYLKEGSKKAAVTVFVAVGILAIANVESAWRVPHATSYADLKQSARKTLAAGLPAARAEAPGQGGIVAKLNDSLAQDELGEQNPFASLSTLDPLNQVFNHGVIGFTRQAYRSPDYQEEIGYDLLSYDIEQKNHTHSTVLAYLERPLTDGENAKRTAVVLVIETRNGLAHQSIYRNSDLMEQAEMPLSQAQALVSHKLNSGIPFFSVSR